MGGRNASRAPEVVEAVLIVVSNDASPFGNTGNSVYAAGTGLVGFGWQPPLNPGWLADDAERQTIVIDGLPIYL